MDEVPGTLINVRASRMTLKIYSDGASRGNPGLASIAFLIPSEDNQELTKYSKVVGLKTNNQAEYEALIAALECAYQLKGLEAFCYSDSLLLIKQLCHGYRVKDLKLRTLWTRVQELKQGFQKVTFIHVLRTDAYIQLVDQLANEALDHQERIKE